MARQKDKTNPIGVRFNKEVLDAAIECGDAKSPSTALVVYEKAYKEKKTPVTDKITAVAVPPAYFDAEPLPKSFSDEFKQIDDTEAQIKAIEAEEIPKHRNTPLGRLNWKEAQEKRINELKFK